MIVVVIEFNYQETIEVPLYPTFKPRQIPDIQKLNKEYGTAITNIRLDYRKPDNG